MVSIDDLKYKYRMLAGHLDERALRRRLGADALCLGYGGASAVAGAAGVSRTTVHAGMKALGEKATTEATATLAVPRIRKPGGGRKAHKDKDAKLLADVDRLLDPVTRGDPMAPLRWTAKSTTKLAEALRAQGHPVSQTTVRRLLDALGTFCNPTASRAKEPIIRIATSNLNTLAPPSKIVSIKACRSSR